jgi:hypothetical protein
MICIGMYPLLVNNMLSNAKDSYPLGKLVSYAVAGVVLVAAYVLHVGVVCADAGVPWLSIMGIYSMNIMTLCALSVLEVVMLVARRNVPGNGWLWNKIAGMLSSYVLLLAVLPIVVCPALIYFHTGVLDLVAVTSMPLLAKYAWLFDVYSVLIALELLVTVLLLVCVLAERGIVQLNMPRIGVMECAVAFMILSFVLLGFHSLVLDALSPVLLTP